jgi:hypothetical protein
MQKEKETQEQAENYVCATCEPQPIVDPKHQNLLGNKASEWQFFKIKTRKC